MVIDRLPTLPKSTILYGVDPTPATVPTIRGDREPVSGRVYRGSDGHYWVQVAPGVVRPAGSGRTNFYRTR